MRTERCLSALIAQLAANCGDMFEACRAVGVSTMFVRQWRKDDAKVNEQLVEAERVGLMRIESVAIQRAVHGHKEDVYYQGDVVGERTVHHDGLLQAVLKAKLDDFKSDGEGGVNVNVQIANVMPRANSYDEWLNMKTATLAARKEMPALEHVRAVPIIDAEYTHVTNAFEGVGL